MEDLLKAGAPVRVVRNGGDTLRWLHGSLVHVSGPALVVDFENDQSDWLPGEGVVLIAGNGTGRLAVAADFFESDDQGWAFRVLGPWRILDRRFTPRFPTELRAEIIDPAGDTVHFGRVLDLSTGGMRVAVAESPESDDVTVELLLFARRAALPCKIVWSRGLEDGAELHLQFRDLNPEQRSLINGCVDILEFVAIHAEELDAA
jgi:hypothetical protein